MAHAVCKTDSTWWRYVVIHQALLNLVIKMAKMLLFTVEKSGGVCLVRRAAGDFKIPKDYWWSRFSQGVRMERFGFYCKVNSK